MKTYLLFSGGIDSIGALHRMSLWKELPDSLAFINYGHAAAEKEFEATKFFAKYYGVDYLYLESIDYEELTIMAHAKWVFSGKSLEAQDSPGSKDDLFLPGRNIWLILCLAIRTYISDGEKVRIALGTHFEEGLPDGAYNTHGDCYPKFYEAFSKALSIGMSTPTSPQEFEIISPIRDHTKTDLIRMLIRGNVPYEKAWSCYEANENPCGKCQHCHDIQKIFAKIGEPDRFTYEHAPE